MRSCTSNKKLGACQVEGPHELKFKLVEEGYIGDILGDFYRGY